jgi:predicted RNA binding protein YcfA (HicA-like mRNA interferase family)
MSMEQITIKRCLILKISELLKLLKDNGCFFVRPGGNHDIYHSPITGKDFPVPRHSTADVKKGLLNRILKQSGIK